MKLLMMATLSVAMLFGLAGAASAQTIPNVQGLTPFTPQTRYMSLEGYLRWQYYQQTARWITWNEAVALVDQQTEVAALPSS
ncbi:MAG: hypothetical protein ACYDCO_02500 [Armatimonadota bacterium]